MDEKQKIPISLILSLLAIVLGVVGAILFVVAAIVKRSDDPNTSKHGHRLDIAGWIFVSPLMLMFLFGIIKYGGPFFFIAFN
jgi:heme/copper-type cytochrome/quinol oxidase subunit 2